MEEMTSKERVLAAFRGEPHDRIPLINPTTLANVDCMRISRAYFPYAHLNAARMAALAETGYKVLKFDTVMPYFGVANEVGALGCDVDWGGNDRLPKVCSSVMRTLDDFKYPQNYLTRRPTKTVISAVELLKKRTNNQVAIIGKVIGPISLLFYLYGIQNTWNSLLLEPKVVEQVLDQIKDLVVSFAVAQVEAGADIITISEDAAGDLISRECYQRIVMPAEIKILKALKGNVFTIFHLSSNIMDRADLFAMTGFDALHFDSRNALPELKKMIGKAKLVGGVSVPDTLLNGNKEHIVDEVYYNIINGVDMIAPDSAVALQVSNQNLLEMHKAIVYFTNRYGNTGYVT